MGFGGGFSRRSQNIIIVSGSDGQILKIYQAKNKLTGSDKFKFEGGNLSLTGNLNIDGNISANNLSSSSPGGSHQQLQYNHSGALEGTSSMTFNPDTNSLTIPTTTVSGALSVSGNISPQKDSSYDLGSENFRWSDIYAANVYTGDFHLKNERGDWTIYEERDFLTVKNNITGEKFKLMLEKLK